MRTPWGIGVAHVYPTIVCADGIVGTAACRSLEIPLGRYRSKNEENVKGSDSVKSEAGNP